jgi:hypothetical protein
MDARDQGEYGGAIQGGTVYASADFPDVDINGDIKPNNSVLSAVSNVVLFHVSEAVDKQQQAKQWRKKIREMLHYHQEKILQFFTKPLPPDHALKIAHTLLSKYGKQIPYDPLRSTPQFFKDYIMEAPQEGANMLNTYLSELEHSRSSDTSIQKWQYMSRHMLDYMRDTGDELIRLDHRLQAECQYIDSVVDKVTQLVALPNPEIPGFQEMMDAYIEKQFELHPIDKIYWDYIFTLQKYSTLRDILLPQRAINQPEPLCCICMTEPIIMAMNPCGHTFCMNCSKKTMVCHFCRRGVTSRLRIYFG